MKNSVIDQLTHAGISHSCFPNSGINSCNELISIRYISDGEKITVDFSTVLKEEELFKCSCGCNGCRGIILGFNYLPLLFQEKYIAKGVAPASMII